MGGSSDEGESRGEDGASDGACVQDPSCGVHDCEVRVQAEILAILAVGNGWEYPRAMLAFLNSRPDGTNFYERNLAAVGYSNGGSTVKTARKALEVEEGSRYWHPRGMDAYVGLRVHSAAKLPDRFTFNGVTLACSRAYEWTNT
ncbi:hypothetical protein BDZ97DRAFT_1755144 [Flammula alnicola]|nr:hypothetical protein BDZ97DRAFT_1755144 [Flammula alnicola]